MSRPIAAARDGRVAGAAVGYVESGGLRRAAGLGPRRDRTAATLEPPGELDAGETGGNMSEEPTLRHVLFGETPSDPARGRRARSDDDYSEDEDYSVADDDDEEEEDDDEEDVDDDEDLDDDEEDEEDLEEDDEEDDDEEEEDAADEDLIDEDDDDDEDLDEEE
jgi:hypothetical protein